MDRYVIRALAWAAALFAAVFLASPVRAQTSAMTMPTGAAPVVRVQMGSGNLTIRTWDRSQVLIESSDAVQARHFSEDVVGSALRGGDIPIFATTVMTPAGTLTLPQEMFALGSLPASPHDGIDVMGGDTGATVRITVPNSSALILALVRRGSVRVQNYRNGALVVRVHTGAIGLSNVSGDGFVEVARGPVFIRQSAFNRLRARTAVGNIFFENCNARQIEVSSINGSIGYDNGTFVPGLARFETQNGNIALGIAGGGARIGAHSANGKVFSDFNRGADVHGSGGDAQAIVGGGGPVVTASSERGNVYLYDGAFRARPRLVKEWRPVARMIHPARAGSVPRPRKP